MTDTTHTSRNATHDMPAHRSPGADAALVTVTVVAVAVGTVLRFLPRSGLWLDEALSVNIANLPITEIPGALRRDGHPPLYYLLLHLWSFAGSSDWWVRALSGVISLAGIPLAYLAGRRLGRRSVAEGLGGHRTGLIAAAIWSLLPFAVRYGAETRMYALVCTLVLVGYLLVDSLVGRPLRADRPSPAAWPAAVGVTVVTTALLYSHYWTLWLGAATALVLVVIGFREVDSERRRRVWITLGAMALGVVLFAPWVPTMLYQSAHTGTPWGEVFRPATILVVTVTDFVGGGFGELQIMSYALVAAIAVAVFGSIRTRSGHQVVEIVAVPRARIGAELGVLLATMVIGWATAAASSSTYASRYAATVAPLFALCTAAGLAMVRTRRATTVVTAIVCVTLIVGSVAEVVTDRTQADVVADALIDDMATNGTTDAVVLTCPDQLGPATSRALTNRGMDLTVVAFPEGDPEFVDWVDYGERNEAADPASFVASSLADDVEDTTVYAVANMSYLTLEGKCEAMIGALGSDGAPVENLVVADADNFFEAMGLWVRRPTG
ncbi:MAG: hypothetical protein ACK5O2_11520 [Microthrixaceae bacterium]